MKCRFNFSTVEEPPTCFTTSEGRRSSPLTLKARAWRFRSRRGMAGPSWLIDSNRIASKIKSASESYDHKRLKWKSNPSRPCPNCNYEIDNTDVAQFWPGLPRGVKFDPSDQELVWHLIAKVGGGDLVPHPFIDEFIPTVDKEDGICYTHPQNLPGLKQDGSVAHFFHRTIKAYNTGTRKRRKIHDLEDVRWHKTGRTKPVLIDGVQKGCKKIMVLYVCGGKREKPEKTNWVMHQYHLGIDEDEKDGEFVVSKIFYQPKLHDKIEQDFHTEIEEVVKIEVVPITPLCIAPNRPRCDKQHANNDKSQSSSIFKEPSAEDISCQETIEEENEVQNNGDLSCQETIEEENERQHDDEENPNEEEAEWWDGESQLLLDSQQLVQELSICDEILQGSSFDKDGTKTQPCLSDYALLGAEVLKRDLEECQKLADFDPSNIELDTAPDFRLSQLEFGSQDSFLAWGGEKVG